MSRLACIAISVIRQWVPSWPTMIDRVRARIEQIPAKEDATWGAVFAALSLTHRTDWHFHWTGYRKGHPDEYSIIDIEAEGEDVDGMRAEIVALVDLVNVVVKRDPLGRMAPIDVGLVEVLIS